MSTTTTTITAPPSISESIINITEETDFETISYAKLIKGDAKELAAIRRACEKDGFWYLDLRTQKGESSPIEPDVEKVYDIVRDFYALEDEEKLQYDVDQIGSRKLNGYTPFGRNAGLKGDARKFGVEAYSLPRDNLCNPAVGEEECILPPGYQRESSFLQSFMNQLHGIGIDMLKALDLTASTDKPLGQFRTQQAGGLASVHRPSKPSTTCMTVGHYPYLSAESPHAGLAAHTDVGSLTILFCGDRGLQAYRATTGQWQYLAAKPGCAVINVGDSLRFLSEKKYRSALHRVVPYPGEVIKNRFSCAYFIRPELDVEFVDEDSKRWKSVEWHMRKYQSYRAKKN